jgi:hypothetical protein
MGWSISIRVDTTYTTPQSARHPGRLEGLPFEPPFFKTQCARMRLSVLLFVGLATCTRRFSNGGVAVQGGNL